MLTFVPDSMVKMLMYMYENQGRLSLKSQQFCHFLETRQRLPVPWQQSNMELNIERDVLQKYGGIKIEHPSLTAHVQHKFMAGSPNSVAKLNGESKRRQKHFT